MNFLLRLDNFKNLKIIICFFILVMSEISMGSSWTKTNEGDLIWKLGIQVPVYSFELQAPVGISNKKINYSPNSNGRLFSSVDYRNLGISFGSSSGSNVNEINEKGQSNITDFQIRMFGKRTYELFYQRYQGFFISNSEDVDSSYNGANKIKRADIETRSYGLNFAWNFNDKNFSPQVAFAQMGQQKKSDWSWMMFTSLSDFEVQGETALVPSTVKSDFGRIGSLQHIKTQSFSMGLGLGGIAAWEGLYITALLGVGGGAQITTAQFEGLADEKNTQGSSVSMFRIGLGYNGEKHILAANYWGDSVAISVGDGRFISSITQFSLYYGYKFSNVNVPIANQISALFD